MADLTPSFPRKSHIDIGNIYFWTATINNWIHLLENDKFKKIIIDSLSYLSVKEKLDVFAFVIMPNHLHFIWRINQMNGKEMPHVSFLKYTAHEFKKSLLNSDKNLLSKFRVKVENKEYEFWQRDSLAIPLYTESVALQKLNYIHNNPVAPHWNLVNDICDYEYSSARLYELNEKKFDFLKNLWDHF